MIAPKELPLQQPRKVRHPRIAAHATRRRRRRAWLLHYGGSARVLIVLALVLAPVMVYVMLTSSLTSMNYQLDTAQAQRLQLQGDVQRLDDRIYALESRERLLAIAKKLGMTDPQQYAIVSLQQPQSAQKPGGLAFLGWLRR